MKIVVASDSFKGSLSAEEACASLEEAINRVFEKAEVVTIPLADGGEGTLGILTAGNNAIHRTRFVRGPLGEMTNARWAILSEGQAVIEMAQASGLNLVPMEQRDAMRASSYGTGQLIQAALDAGCRDILLSVGGSATTDGGLGALNALGLKTFDSRSRALEMGGADLMNLIAINSKFLDPRLEKTHFTILCDVFNPLTGPDGAAYVYSGQKGATAGQIKQLDRALHHWANVVADFTGSDLRNAAGAGAAGGLGFAISAFCKADLRSGIDTVLEKRGFAKEIVGADLILTGEGSLDAQTLKGKVVFGVCQLAHRGDVPVIAFGGNVLLNGEQLDDLGLLSAFSITDGPQNLDFCSRNAFALLSSSAERALRLWKAKRK